MNISVAKCLHFGNIYFYTISFQSFDVYIIHCVSVSAADLVSRNRIILLGLLVITANAE